MDLDEIRYEQRLLAKRVLRAEKRARKPPPPPYIPPVEKACSHCREIKPLLQFGAGQCRDGKNSWCRPCCYQKSSELKKQRCASDPAYREALAEAKRVARRAADPDLDRRLAERAARAETDAAARALKADCKAHVIAYHRHLVRQMRPVKPNTRRAASLARTEADLEQAAYERAKSAYRRARRLGRVVPWCSMRDTLPVYREAALVEFHMGVQWDVDHEIPLRGGIVSGLHVVTNLSVKPRVVNESKANKFLSP